MLKRFRQACVLDKRGSAGFGDQSSVTHSSIDEIRGAFLVFAITISCAPMRRQPVAEDFRQYQEAQKLFEQGLYREAVNTYRGIEVSEPHSAWAEKATFNVAYNLVYYRNPDRDYAGARREFEEFLLRYPATCSTERHDRGSRC